VDDHDGDDHATGSEEGLLQGTRIHPLRVISVDEVELLEPLVRVGHSLYDILRAHSDDGDYRNLSLRNFLQARFGALPLNEPIRAELNAIESHAGYLLFGRDLRQAVETGIEPPDLPHEEIARRAYELFEQRGQAHGHDVEDWLRAEDELRVRKYLQGTE
jgi:hypothetical protein